MKASFHIVVLLISFSPRLKAFSPLQNHRTPNPFILQESETLPEDKMLKISKKAKATATTNFTAIPIVPKEKPAKLKLVIDTSCQGIGKMSWEDVYNLIEK